MNRERAKELLPIIEAYSKGKTVQYRPLGSRDWNDDMGDVGFHEDGFEFRIKPEPHDIKWAAEQMEAGKQVRRGSWNNEEYRVTRSGIIQLSHEADPRPHQMSYLDLLADDWEIYEPKETK